MRQKCYNIIGPEHGCRGAPKFATSTKHFKTESDSRPTYVKHENSLKNYIFIHFASFLIKNLLSKGILC